MTLKLSKYTPLFTIIIGLPLMVLGYINLNLEQHGLKTPSLHDKSKNLQPLLKIDNSDFMAIYVAKQGTTWAELGQTLELGQPEIEQAYRCTTGEKHKAYEEIQHKTITAGRSIKIPFMEGAC